MKRKTRIVAFAAMIVMAVAGTITGIAYAADTESCNQFIQRNHVYRDGTRATWATDGEGRPSVAILHQVTAQQGQRGQCQGQVGRWAGPGYDGGHLIAASMGGPDYRYNMVAETVTVNRSGMASAERGVLACVRRGFSVRNYSVVANYANNTDITPGIIYVEFEIYGGGSIEKFTGFLRNGPSDPVPDEFKKGLRDTFDTVGC